MAVIIIFIFLNDEKSGRYLIDKVLFVILLAKLVQATAVSKLQ